MIKSYSLCIIVLLSMQMLLSYKSFTQNEANNWYFGNGAGITFNTTPPSALFDGQLSTDEGCSSISDPDGNLLFYTDGVTVWDKNHNIMPNGTGLFGNPSSAQSGIIVPKPGNPNIYYIFTIALSGNANGLSYSEVDLTLNGGTGDVTANKNINLFAGSDEQVAAAKHANGTDYWVLSYQCNNNQLFAYKVDGNGVDTNPVLSNSGSVHPCSSIVNGYLKASPDGTKVARVFYEVGGANDMVQLFNFDASTGEVTNQIATFTGYNVYYGLEFSPSSKILYLGVASPPAIYQYDISSENEPIILASEVDLNVTVLGAWVGALQLGPDQKIYSTDYGSNFLSVIHNPDVLGLGCDYEPGYIDLTPNISRLGLPPFISSIFLDADFTYDGTCYGDTTFFSLSSNANPDAVFWDFGDPNTSTDVSSLEDSFYIYPDTGKYTVTLISELGGVYDTAVQEVHIKGKFLNPIEDQVICNGIPVMLDAMVSGASYEWSNASTNTTLQVSSAPTTIWVDVTYAGCTERDSIFINKKDLTVNLGNDTTLCPGETMHLNASTIGATYTWSDGSQTPTYNVVKGGTYWVEVLVDGCPARDTLNVSYYPGGQLNLGKDILLCDSTEKVTLSSNILGTAFLWNTGSNLPSIEAKPIKLYTLSMVDQNNCIQQDSVFVNHKEPQVYIGEDYTYCLGEHHLLNAGQGYVSYRWSTGQRTPIIEVNETGEYVIEVIDKNNCYVSDTANITFEGCALFVPNSFSPNGDGINDKFLPKAENILNYHLSIFNRYGQEVFQTDKLNEGWDGKFKGALSQQGVYSYIITYQSKIDFEEVEKRGRVTLFK